MSHYSFNYETYADDDCKYPIETHWLIEFDAWKATPQTYMEPGDPAGIEFTAKHLMRVVCWVTDRGFDLNIDDHEHAARVFAKHLDEELLIEAASEYLERYGRDLDDEGRRVA